jgi:hypothetical protein
VEIIVRAAENERSRRKQDRLDSQFGNARKRDGHAIQIRVVTKPKWVFGGAIYPEETPRYVVYIDVEQTDIPPAGEFIGTLFVYKRAVGLAGELEFVGVATPREYLTLPFENNKGEQSVKGPSDKFIGGSVVKAFSTKAEADAFLKTTEDGLKKFLADWKDFEAKNKGVVAYWGARNSILTHAATETTQ